MSDDKVAGVATVLYLFFLPLYPVIAAVMEDVSSNVVIAVATVVNVIVTSVYAAFTWGLWRETRAAARTAADQAQTTRQIFEAGHRPYLQIISEHGRVPGGDGQRANHEFRFQFHNHGVVPAIVTRWDMVVMRGEKMVNVDHEETREIGSVVGMAVFPESSSYFSVQK